VKHERRLGSKEIHIQENIQQESVTIELEFNSHMARCASLISKLKIELISKLKIEYVGILTLPKRTWSTS
jgi:hypothetical protein